MKRYTVKPPNGITGVGSKYVGVKAWKIHEPFSLQN